MSILAIDAVRFEDVFVGHLLIDPDKNVTVADKLASGGFQKLLQGV